ncbi:MAG: HAD family hydrolase [Candidatus Bathyarchaeia archaeon]|jgi:putative hydrolase of the HAD superfamily
MLQLTKDHPNNGKAFHCRKHRHSKQNADAVLFDLFDTLVLLSDEQASYINSLKTTHKYLSENGLNCSFKAFKQAYLKTVDKIYTETAISLEEPHFSVYIEDTINELNHDLKDKTFLALEAVNKFSEEFKKYITLDTQALEVLESIHENHKIGLISNLSFSECAWDLLDKFSLKQFLDVIIVSGDVNLRKPHPQIFNMGLRYLGVKPSRTVFVGDTLETDIVGSKNVGMTSVHIKRRTAQNVDITPHQTITELKQLLPIIGLDEIALAP